jgi:carbon-monoxide dehydrogenase medium subunit
MIPRFSLARPRALADAFEAHAATNGDGAYYAGGTELLQVMKMGFAQFGTLIDLKGIAELAGIEVDSDGWLRIGATTTHRQVERSAIVREAVPALARLAGDVANVRVRNTGTLGGNLAFAEPHSDPATFLLACGAEVELAAPSGRRRIGIGEFVLGPLFTAREVDEIVASIRVPAAGPGEGRGYAKIRFFERPAASVGVSLRVESGRVAEANVTAGSLTEIPVPVPGAAASLVGATLDRDGTDLARALREAGRAFAELDAVPDLNGSADYKRHLAGILLRRAVGDALDEASARA